MSDPAVEAARRAWEGTGDDLADNDVAVDTAIAAAREDDWDDLAAFRGILLWTSICFCIESAAAVAVGWWVFR